MGAATYIKRLDALLRRTVEAEIDAATVLSGRRRIDLSDLDGDELQKVATIWTEAVDRGLRGADLAAVATAALDQLRAGRRN